jgi:hypothetical protein
MRGAGEPWSRSGTYAGISGSATSDEAINRISLDDRRVVISKDTEEDAKPREEKL